MKNSNVDAKVICCFFDRRYVEHTLSLILSLIHVVGCACAFELSPHEENIVVCKIEGPGRWCLSLSRSFLWRWVVGVGLCVCACVCAWVCMENICELEQLVSVFLCFCFVKVAKLPCFMMYVSCEVDKSASILWLLSFRLHDICRSFVYALLLVWASRFCFRFTTLSLCVLGLSVSSRLEQVCICVCGVRCGDHYCDCEVSCVRVHVL